MTNGCGCPGSKIENTLLEQEIDRVTAIIQLREDMKREDIKKLILKIKELGGKIIYYSETAKQIGVEIDVKQLEKIAELTGIVRIYANPEIELHPKKKTKKKRKTEEEKKNNPIEIAQELQGMTIDEVIEKLEIKNINSTGKGIKIGVIDSGADCNVGAKVIDVIDRDKIDYIGHGSAVCHIIRKIAPDAEIIAVKIFGRLSKTKLHHLLQALEILRMNKVDIINMSLGSLTPYPAMHTMVNKLREQGILLIASAGNNGYRGTINYPAGFCSCIAVGSLSPDFVTLSDFSSRGPSIEGTKPDIVAPGEDLKLCYGKEFKVVSGTSFSAPIVTGVFALLAEKNRRVLKRTVAEFLLSVTKKLRRERKDNLYGYGLIDPVTMQEYLNKIQPIYELKIEGTSTENGETFVYLRIGSNIETMVPYKIEIRGNESSITRYIYMYLRQGENHIKLNLGSLKPGKYSFNIKMLEC